MDNRRHFLKAAAGVTAASAQRVLGANERIRVAGIGVGGRCQGILSHVKQAPNTEIVAVCDVYGPRREQARQKLAPEAREYVDYRELLERKDIDAVVIGSPDHWHVPMTIDAIRAGKDVYVEKPLTKTIEEGERIIKAAAESKQIVQVGYQQRSWDHIVVARDLIASGRLGKVSLVLSSWYQNYLRYDPNPQLEPAKLDWKRWLGSAPDQPVVALRYFRWRWFWDFGGGHLTDLHSHWGDTIHWLMGAESPRSAQASGGNHVLPQYECPDTISATWDYPGFTLVYTGSLMGHLEGGNIVFRGSKAMMKLNRDGFTVYPEGVIPPEKTSYPEPEIAMRSQHDGTIDHVRNFLDCVRSRKTPNAPVPSSVAAASAAHMANAAYRKFTGR